MDLSVIEVQIKGLLPTPGGSGVFLEAEGKAITIFIDAMCTKAFNLVLKGQEAPRPLTHDLVKAVLTGLEVKVIQVVIYALEEETFFARLHLQQENELGKKILELDARPSDCMIVALQHKAPIYVNRKVWDRVEDMSWAIEHLSQGNKAP